MESQTPAPGRRRLVRLAAPLALAAAAGAGITLAVHDPSRPTVAPVTTSTTVSGRPAASRVGGLAPTEIYRRSVPGIVEITVTSTGGGFTPFDQQQSQGQGSGFVMDDAGHILTNEHVVEGAEAISVRFHDGSTAGGTLVGSDPSTDVAVVKVDVASSKLHPLPLGTASGVLPGETVFAIGSPFGLENSISAGIVSAVGRTIKAPDGSDVTGAVQTDAALNHGNSGGPLIDAAGKVIGINSQIESDSGSDDGVGFAVPIDTARQVASTLIRNGSVERGFLGVSGRDVTADDAAKLDAVRGVAVLEVTPGSAADRAGLKVNDVVLAVDGTPVAGFDSLRAIIARHAPGDALTLRIVRDGKRQEVEVTLGRRPS